MKFCSSEILLRCLIALGEPVTELVSTYLVKEVLGSDPVRALIGETPVDR